MKPSGAGEAFEDGGVEPEVEAGLLQWLLEGDPAIRWRVLRDLTDASDEEVIRERARVANEGWGARLLAAQDPNGHSLLPTG